MDSSEIHCSDNNGCAYGADFSNLARELDIPESVLKSALEDAADFMRECRPPIRPANKKALRGVARLLAKTIEQLSDVEVRERLTSAALERPEEPDEEGFADDLAWSAALLRVDQAIEGARDLLAIVKRGEAINFRAGRPQYHSWRFAIQLLLGYWIDDLQRKVTISRHPDDGPDVKPSPALRFVHQSMRLIGERIPEQACRRILQNLKEEGDNFGIHLNEF